MIFSYDWLKQYLKLPKPEELAQLLTMHSFEVESVNKIKGDYVLDIDVLPNRGPDCFSHLGIARECAAILGSKFQIPEFKIKEDKKLKTKDFISLEVKQDCQRYTARVVVGVKVKDSPQWIKEKLRACGLRPINNIVDAANLVMLETGQPLHAFDLDKISGARLAARQAKLLVRRAKKGEKIISLDDEKYNLDKDVLIIADDKDPLAIAGIKGGKKAEIDKKTRTIILESANFDSKVIRQGSKKIGLRTDASWRFENKIDPNLTEMAVNRLAELIQDLAGGKIASGLIDFYPKKNKPKRVKLDLRYLKKLLGIEISKKEVKNILERLGFEVKELSSLNLEVGVPSFRLDISWPEDLIEEVGRIYGYEKISDAFPVASLIPPEKNLDIFWQGSVKNILKELEFTEVYNYSFIGDKDFKLLKCSSKEIIELENPISLDQKYLRPSLIPNLLNNVGENFKYFDDIKIFEIGKTFNKQGERTMLTGLIAGKHNKDQFYHLKGEMDYLFHKHGIANVWYDEHKPTPEQSKICLWQKGKCAEIKVGNQEIGFLGEVSLSLLKQGKVVVFDIDFEKFKELCSEEWEYQPVSQYPSTIRDLAILVPINVKVIEVMNIINNVGGSLIKDVDLFDIYEGEGLDYNRKSLAFHIIYQAEDRTLRASEINTIQNKIIKTLEKKSQWRVRK